ncbi:hypothetical protein AB4144_51455, partial [Rhizobiaceae sp. 2RAB30]
MTTNLPGILHADRCVELFDMLSYDVPSHKFFQPAKNDVVMKDHHGHPQRNWATICGRKGKSSAVSRHHILI